MLSPVADVPVSKQRKGFHLIMFEKQPQQYAFCRVSSIACLSIALDVHVFCLKTWPGKILFN